MDEILYEVIVKKNMKDIVESMPVAVWDRNMSRRFVVASFFSNVLLCVGAGTAVWSVYCYALV